MKNCTLLSFLWLVLINTACTERVPVMVGGEEDYDACGAAAEVFSPSKKEVIVYSAPSDAAEAIGEVSTGIYVSVCDFSDESIEGDWVGIVYKNEESQVCGVGATIETRQAYSGPCKSGWIKKVNLTNWAG